jgi:FkbM family methyltransferase
VIGSRLAGQRGRVYAFEPVPANAALVGRNAALNGLRNVEVLPMAVTDHTGRAEMVLAAYAGGAALSTAPRPPDATGTLPVDATSIDHLVFDAGMTPPTLVKIDVEGAEMEVLRGMARTCAVHRPAIICEIDAGNREDFQAKHQACAGFLRELGYQVRDLADSYPGGDWLVGHLVATPVAAPAGD